VGKDQIKASNNLKELMSQAAVLTYPNFSMSFVLYTDASDAGIEAVLVQERMAISRSFAMFLGL